MVYDNAMLEDLDSLAARIGQLVQFSKQLQSERVALQARVIGLEQERNALRDELKRREAEFNELAESKADHQARLDILRAEADNVRVTLQGEVERYKSEQESLRRELAASQADCARLRAATGQAQLQIDSILMRLPGAPQEQ
jgi:Multidrug resistance efflux pump